MSKNPKAQAVIDSTLTKDFARADWYALAALALDHGGYPSDGGDRLGYEIANKFVDRLAEQEAADAAKGPTS